MRLLALLIASALASGCASFSADGGLGPAQRTAREHLGGTDLAWPRSDDERAAVDQRVAALLREPLSSDAAVQIALLNHRGLRATLHELGLSEAALVGASMPPGLGLSFARLKAGDEVEFERALHVSLAGWLALPWRREAAARRFETTQLDVAQRVLEHGLATRRAWVHAVAAREQVRYATQVMRAAEAGAELAKRMQQAGNFSALQAAREQAFFADAALQLARAQSAETGARERLTRLLGLWGEAATGFTLPERLPDLPPGPRTLPQAEATAVAQRLDLAAARRSAEQLAADRGLTRVLPWIDGLDLGLQRNTLGDGATQRGVELGITLPLFDLGRASRAQSDHALQQAVLRAEQTAIDARSEVREAYATYRSAWDIARHQREEIVGLRRRMLDENLLRYNGMLIGVFELLADARAQVASVQTSIDTLRDFWLAQADLEQALVGKAPSAALASAASPPSAAVPRGDGH